MCVSVPGVALRRDSWGWGVNHCGFWELHSGPLKEQVLLSDMASLQPPSSFLDLLD